MLATILGPADPPLPTCRRGPVRRAVVPVLGLLLLVGCTTTAQEAGTETDAAGSESTAEMVCEHGTVTECACTDGSMGVQMCKHDGSGFDPCVCDGASTSGAGSGTDEGTSSGDATSTDGSTTPAGTTFGSTAADSGTESSTDQPQIGESPTVVINHPSDGEERQAGSNIPFIAVATDPEDGDLDGNAVTWASDVEGVIGNGVNFQAALQTLGAHVITVSAVDSDGNEATDMISLEIVP